MLEKDLQNLAATQLFVKGKEMSRFYRHQVKIQIYILIGEVNILTNTRFNLDFYTLYTLYVHNFLAFTKMAKGSFPHQYGFEQFFEEVIKTHFFLLIFGSG